MADKYPPLSRLVGLKPAEIEILLRGLQALEGDVDDLETLEGIEALRKKIRENLDSRSSVYGM